MDYRKGKGEIVVRLDEGDEIIASLVEIAVKEKIHDAIITGIGAASRVELGHYDEQKGDYKTKKFDSALFEIVSLNGNITTYEGKPFVHLHIAIGLEDFTTVSGHLMSAAVKPTCEIVIFPLKTKISRRFDPKSKLRLQEFE